MDEIYIKINIFGYVDILLNLFFEPYLFFNMDNSYEYIFLKCFYHKGILILDNKLEINTTNITNKSPNNLYYETSLTGDISFLNIFIQNLKYNNSQDEDEIIISYYLKKLLLNEYNKGIFVGLMATDYDAIPLYTEIYDFLINKFNKYIILKDKN